MCLGNSRWSRKAFTMWSKIMTTVLLAGWVADPQKKVFKPKNGLPALEDYSGPAPEAYWSQFPGNRPGQGKSLVDHIELVKLAQEHGCEDWDRLFKVCQDLKYGADIGCREHFRAPVYSKNASSAFAFGEQVSDEIANWIKKGFAAGPFLESEVPAEAKINSIMCREKPNGAVRIILNLSAPAGMSVNDGIDKNEFPATMSSTSKWLEVLDKVGKGAWMAKTDWSDAYKHLHVRAEDLVLQWFSWLGRFFFELCLIFGSSSSPGLYDRLAKTVLDLVLRISKFPRDWVCQHLDDTAAACPADSLQLMVFDQTYIQVAHTLGIKLAPRDDPEKAFGPSKHGIVFGVEYDTESWTWGLPREKLAKIAHQIKGILQKQEEHLEVIQSVVGRIVHVRPLVKDGRFHVDHLMDAMLEADKAPRNTVLLSAAFKQQLYFWYLILVTCDGRACIPEPEHNLPPWAIECFTDASGGTLEGPGRGVGAVIPAFGWWVYMPWTRAINSGSWVVGGKKVSRKMAALELIGPLLAVTAAAALCKGKPIKFWVDNQGSCGIWKHGYSNSCKLSNTIVKAIATIGAALGSRIDICKVRRCSNAGAAMADAISKADWGRFKAEGGSALNLEPARVPKSLLKWAVKPVVDDELGSKIVKDLAREIPILGLSS